MLNGHAAAARSQWVGWLGMLLGPPPPAQPAAREPRAPPRAAQDDSTASLESGSAGARSSDSIPGVEEPARPPVGAAGLRPQGGVDPASAGGYIYDVVLHELALSRDVAMGNTILHLEIADTKYHVPIQECFRKSRGRERSTAAANGTHTSSSGASTPSTSPRSQPTPAPSVGDDGVLRARFRSKFPFVDFHIYLSTEAMLSKEVSGQTTISLSKLYTERGNGGTIAREKFSVWYVKGKLVPKYYSGIPEIPSSCLKEPKEIGTVVVSVELVNPFYQRPLEMYLTPYTPEQLLLKNPYERRPGDNKFSVTDDVEDQIYRVLRAYERFVLHVRSVPYCVEHIIYPLLWFHNPVKSLLSMAIIAFTTLYTPVWAIPLDIFFIFLFLSLLSKGQTPMDCIVWPNDPRLREPPNTPHTMIGQFYYVKTLLQRFVRLVENLLDRFEMLSSLFDFTEPVATLSMYGVIFGFLALASTVLWVVATAGEYFAARNVVCFIILIPYYRGGYKNMKRKYKAGEFNRFFRRFRRARRRCVARMLPARMVAGRIAACGRYWGGRAWGATCDTAAWAVRVYNRTPHPDTKAATGGWTGEAKGRRTARGRGSSKVTFEDEVSPRRMRSNMSSSATSHTSSRLRRTDSHGGWSTAEGGADMMSCASSQGSAAGRGTPAAPAIEMLARRLPSTSAAAARAAQEERGEQPPTTPATPGNPLLPPPDRRDMPPNLSMYSCLGDRSVEDDESDDSGIDAPDPDAFDLEEFIDRIEEGVYARLRLLGRRLAVIFEKIPTVPEKEHRHIARFQRYPLHPRLQGHGHYIRVPLPQASERPRAPHAQRSMSAGSATLAARRLESVISNPASPGD